MRVIDINRNEANEEDRGDSDNSDNFYAVFVICTNCGFDNSIEIRKGVLVGEVTCIDCECETLIRSRNNNV